MKRSGRVLKTSASPFPAQNGSEFAIVPLKGSVLNQSGLLTDVNSGAFRDHRLRSELSAVALVHRNRAVFEWRRMVLGSVALNSCFVGVS